MIPLVAKSHPKRRPEPPRGAAALEGRLPSFRNGGESPKQTLRGLSTRVTLFSPSRTRCAKSLTHVSRVVFQGSVVSYRTLPKGR